MTMTDNEPDLDAPIIGGVKYDDFGLVIEDETYPTNINHVSVFVSDGTPKAGIAKRSEIEAWLLTVPDKFTADDVKASDDLLYFAEQYVTKCGPGSSNDFVRGLVDSLDKWSKLTAGQARGVLNVWRADVIYRAGKTQAAVNERAVANGMAGIVTMYSTKGLDLNSLESGYYADPLHTTGEAETRLKVKINHTDYGYTYVNDAAVYGQGDLYGVQKPGRTYAGKIEDVLERIIADPKSAMIAYGMLTKRCGRCHRPLEDEQSVADGIGPICKGKLGW